MHETDTIDDLIRLAKQKDREITEKLQELDSLTAEIGEALSLYQAGTENRLQGNISQTPGTQMPPMPKIQFEKLSAYIGRRVLLHTETSGGWHTLLGYRELVIKADTMETAREIKVRRPCGKTEWLSFDSMELLRAE